MSKVVITGGAGFVGSNLVEFFNKNSPETSVIVVDDLSTGRIANLEGHVCDFVEADLSQAGSADSAFANASAIVHLAALGSVPRSIADPVRSHEANINATVNVLELARDTRAQVVFASSSSVYGANPNLPKNERDWTRPLSPYAVTKLAGESYVLAYQASYGLPALAFRFFNVYGPKQPADHAYAAVIPRFLDAAMKGAPLPIHGDGLQSRDFTFVDTVCQVLHQSVTRKITSTDPVNLAVGTNTTLLRLVELMEQALGHELPKEFTAARPGDVRASQADGVRLRELFPTVQAEPLEVGLRETIEWFQKQG